MKKVKTTEYQLKDNEALDYAIRKAIRFIESAMEQMARGLNHCKSLSS